MYSLFLIRQAFFEKKYFSFLAADNGTGPL